MKRGCVKKMLFDDLVESIKEAGKIHRGEMPPSRKFVFTPMDIKAIRKGKSSKVTRQKGTTDFHPGPLCSSWCRRGDLNPHVVAHTRP